MHCTKRTALVYLVASCIVVNAIRYTVYNIQRLFIWLLAAPYRTNKTHALRRSHRFYLARSNIGVNDLNEKLQIVFLLNISGQVLLHPLLVHLTVCRRCRVAIAISHKQGARRSHRVCAARSNIRVKSSMTSSRLESC